MYIIEKNVPNDYKINENKIKFNLKNNDQIVEINIEKEKIDTP